MFSKLAGNFAPIEGAGSVLPLSIAARLTLWQAVCGSLLLVVATALLYWTLESSLNRDDDDFLSGRMQVLVPMLAGSAESPTEIAEEIARESGSRNPFRLYIRLLNGEGGSDRRNIRHGRGFAGPAVFEGSGARFGGN